MSTEAPPGAESAPGPEVLTTGIEPLSRGTKQKLLIGVLVLAVLAAGFAAWRLWPRPPAPFSLSDLQNVYVGMVRSDGTNDASVLSRENFAVPTASVTPSACEPLFEETTFSGFPDTALDGVGTYWPSQQMAVSLFTFRFADQTAAAEQFRRIDDAVTACAGRRVEIAPRPLTEPPSGTPFTRSGSLARTAPVPLAGVDLQTGYLFTTSGGTTFAVQVFVYANLVSWQFRYDPGTGTYDPSQADQVTTSLADRIRFIDSERG
ncbi:hypothetical protein [Microlunatus ginsengisoli]|uniref:PknH-like extracellular domain-containing protein n=1 Tax=Microlunatus ginsengisoli TaxID=363863 RepID=A0ABP6ZM73_9ACTN